MIKALLISLSFVFAITFFTAVDGLVLLAYWEWFLIPLGVIRINLLSAIALAALIKHFTCHYQPARRDEDAFDKALDFLMMRPMLTLGFGLFIYVLVQ